LEPLDTEQDDQAAAEDDNQKTENIEDEVEENTLEETTPLTAFSNAFNNATKNTACKIHPTQNTSPLESLTNGLDTSGNKANETITSSIGDITIDSVRDHLNTTSSTLHSQVTEEIVGRLSVLSTQTNKIVSTANAKDILSYNSSDFNDLKQYGADTDEYNTSSVVIKSVITTVTHGEDGEATTTKTTTTTNGESTAPTAENLSTIITRKESQF
jgi:lethal(2) giant larvae protein